jgi:hypothetical protein
MPTCFAPTPTFRNAALLIPALRVWPVTIPVAKTTRSKAAIDIEEIFFIDLALIVVLLS